MLCDVQQLVILVQVMAVRVTQGWLWEGLVLYLKAILLTPKVYWFVSTALENFEDYPNGVKNFKKILIEVAKKNLPKLV